MIIHKRCCICIICGNRYKTQVTLRQHTKLKHSMTTKEDTFKPTYEDPIGSSDGEEEILHNEYTSQIMIRRNITLDLDKGIDEEET